MIEGLFGHQLAGGSDRKRREGLRLGLKALQSSLVECLAAAIMAGVLLPFGSTMLGQAPCTVGASLPVS
jgi:hypothetical protein